MIQILSYAHAEQCSHLHRFCFEKQWDKTNFEDFFNNPSITIWGYWQYDILIGLLCIAITVDEAEIYTLCTHPKHRNKNIATNLLKVAHQECKNRLVTLLNLEVATNNKAAIDCYLKHNYKKIAIRKNYYTHLSENQDAYVMQLLL
jgi:ribosomal-protein-alanine N-acetyltransferase